MTASDHGTSESAEGGRSRSPDPGQELREIGEDECFALLESQDLGRLAVVREGRPEIFPVNYALDGRTITIRTGTGVKLNYASLAHVAFEVEDLDPVTREGWVVEVRGFAEEITDTGDRWSEHARHAGVTPWVMGAHDHFLAISHVEVSGRRIGSPAAT
jgi:nitroimidazol reductase NimA-like FMN-containing flavoprotein (pyridoxamine 5'-phosphate oxidase superfamily)